MTSILFAFPLFNLKFVLMIKRTATLLLTLLYAVTACGLVFNMHYCGRILTSVQINSPSKSCVKAERKMKCCNDKQLEVKIKDAHQSASVKFVSKTTVVDLLPVLFGGHFFTAQQPLPGKLLSRAPPNHPLGDVPVFIKNCTFRI
jgi:hypothetical protein